MAAPLLLLGQVDSFFRFFSPPDLPGEDDEIEEEAMEELQMMVEADYEVRRGGGPRGSLLVLRVGWRRARPSEGRRLARPK